MPDLKALHSIISQGINKESKKVAALLMKIGKRVCKHLAVIWPLFTVT